MKRMMLLFLLAVTGATFGCKTVGDAGSAENLRSKRHPRYPAPVYERTLQPGDHLQILLHSQERQEMVEVVDDRGTVKFPHLGAVKLIGLTTAEAEEFVEKEYVRREFYKEGAIHVAIVPPVAYFYVQGHVNRPGQYPFTRDQLRLSQALSIAGGPTEFADSNRRKIIRGRETIEVDMRDVRKGKIPDPAIEPGDIVEVPRGWM